MSEAFKTLDEGINALINGFIDEQLTSGASPIDIRQQVSHALTHFRSEPWRKVEQAVEKFHRSEGERLYDEVCERKKTLHYRGEKIKVSSYDGYKRMMLYHMVPRPKHIDAERWKRVCNPRYHESVDGVMRDIDHYLADTRRDKVVI